MYTVLQNNKVWKQIIIAQICVGYQLYYYPWIVIFPSALWNTLGSN